jgi:hypothetical protein
MLLRAIQRQQLVDRLAHAINYADDLKSIAGNLENLTVTGEPSLSLCIGIRPRPNQNKVPGVSIPL